MREIYICCTTPKKRKIIREKLLESMVKNCTTKQLEGGIVEVRVTKIE